MGALTSKPYAFKARPWELKNINSIDFFEALGSSIRVDVRGSEILRVLPIPSEEKTFPFISDKIRFFHDSLSLYRLHYPAVRWFNFLRRKTSHPIYPRKAVKPGTILLVSTAFFFDYLQYYFILVRRPHTAIFNSLGPYSGLQDILVLKYFLPKISSHFTLSAHKWKSQTLNYNSGLETCDNYVFCNFNPRIESPVFWLELKRKNANFFSFGINIQNAIFLGNSFAILQLLQLKHPLIKKLFKGETFMFLFGSAFFLSHDALSYSSLLNKFKNKINSFFGNSRINFNFIPADISTLGQAAVGVKSTFLSTANNLPIKKEDWFFSFPGGSMDLLLKKQFQGSIVSFCTHLEVKKPYPDFFYPVCTPFEDFGSFFTLKEGVKSVTPVVLSKDFFSLSAFFWSFFLVKHFSFEGLSFENYHFSLLPSNDFLVNFETDSKNSLLNSVFEPFTSNYFFSDTFTYYSDNLRLASYHFNKTKTSFSLK